MRVANLLRRLKLTTLQLAKITVQIIRCEKAGMTRSRDLTVMLNYFKTNTVIERKMSVMMTKRSA